MENKTEDRLADLLPVLLDSYLPCELATSADNDISTKDLQLSLMEHTGEEFSAILINDWMRLHAFRERSTCDFRIVWMLKKRDVL